MGYKGICPKCLLVKRMTAHHVYPRRFFGGEGPLLSLCRGCHNLIELIYPATLQLEKEDYLQICREFLIEEWLTISSNSGG